MMNGNLNSSGEDVARENVIYGVLFRYYEKQTFVLVVVCVYIQVKL